MRSLPRTTPHPFPGRPARFRMVAACATLALAGVSRGRRRSQRLTTSSRRSSARRRARSAARRVTCTSPARRWSPPPSGSTRARAALTAAQRRLAVAQKNADAAARVDAQMQAGCRWPSTGSQPARVALDAARKRVAEQRTAIGRLAASNYANGDPALMGLSVMLNSQDPAEVTTQMNTVTTLMSRQTTMLEQLKVARAQMVVQEAEVEKARAEVAVQRQAARREPGPQAGPRAVGRGGARRGRHAGRRGHAPPRSLPPAHARPTCAQLAHREEAGGRDPPADHRARAPSARRLRGDTGGFLSGRSPAR